MPTEPINDKNPPFLIGFASILSLLGITLFFSGWIYRWAYFAYFSLKLNDQSFTAQSFLIVPIQIYLGTPSKESLENQGSPGENGEVIAGQDWIDGRQAARFR